MTQIPAGWYPDPAPGEPGVPTGQRYWDGTQWTDHVAPGGYDQMQQYDGPQGAPYKQVRTTPDGEELAAWLPRLGAYVLDGIIVGIVSSLLALPLLVDYVRKYSRAMDEMIARAETGSIDPWAGMPSASVELAGLTAVSLLVALCYHGGFLRWRAATPGKMALGLRVRLREVPGQLPWSAIGLRLLVQNVASVFSLVPYASLLVGWFPLLDGLWPLWDDKNQALHDKAARTNVVVSRRQA